MVITGNWLSFVEREDGLDVESLGTEALHPEKKAQRQREINMSAWKERVCIPRFFILFNPFKKCCNILQWAQPQDWAHRNGFMQIRVKVNCLGHTLIQSTEALAHVTSVASYFYASGPYGQIVLPLSRVMELMWPHTVHITVMFLFWLTWTWGPDLYPQPSIRPVLLTVYHGPYAVKQSMPQLSHGVLPRLRVFAAAGIAKMPTTSITAMSRETILFVISITSFQHRWARKHSCSGFISRTQTVRGWIGDETLP